MKNITTELKNLIEGFNNRLDQVEERISELEVSGYYPIRGEKIKNNGKG